MLPSSVAEPCTRLFILFFSLPYCCDHMVCEMISDCSCYEMEWC